MSSISNYIRSVRFEFERYKKLGDATLRQANDLQLFFEPGGGTNSLAILVKHLAGNMKSRWTDILTTDGEKPWRNRESEFTDPPKTREELLEVWESGWSCLFQGMDTLAQAPEDSVIFIRNQPHSIYEAVNRQLGHYSYHVGQMVSLARLLLGTSWEFQSIPPGQSEAFNQAMKKKGS